MFEIQLVNMSITDVSVLLTMIEDLCEDDPWVNVEVGDS